MKLDDLIARLEEFRKEHGGDVVCYGNGEHGFDDGKVLTESMVSAGKANIELPFSLQHPMSEEQAEQVVVHIGGY